jgi:hypothetical protein
VDKDRYRNLVEKYLGNCQFLKPGKRKKRSKSLSLLPGDGNRLQSPERCFNGKKENGTMGNVEKFNNFEENEIVEDRKGRAIAQAVSRWLPTAAARVQTRVWSSGICGGQSGAGAAFLRVFRFPLPILFHQILHHHNHLGQVQ